MSTVQRTRVIPTAVYVKVYFQSQEEAKSRTAKLEKADILEMAVKHVQFLHDKYRVSQGVVPDGQSSDRVRVRRIARLASGEVALIVTTEESSSQSSEDCQQPRLMWRPW